MSDISVDVSEWKKLDRDILFLAEETMPRECKKFMRREGGRAATTTRKLAKATFKKKTGNYFRSIRGSRAWKSSYGSYGVKVYAKRPEGSHAHLLEYGHKVLIRGKYPISRRADDFHTIQKGTESFENRFASDCQAFVDELVEKGMRGK